MRKPNNVSARLLSSRLAQGSQRAFTFTDNSLTHEDLWQRARQAAAILMSRGVAARHNVLFAMDDRLEWPILFHALILIGAVPVVVMPTADAEYIDMITQRIKIDHALGDTSLIMSESVRAGNKIAWQEVSGNADPIAWGSMYEYQDHDVWIVLTSSGTTGNPKLITHRHLGLEETFTRFNPFGFTAQDRILCSVKMASSFGVIMNVLGCAAMGMESVILDTPGAYRDFDCIMREHRITHAMLTPRMISFLLKHQQQPFHKELQRVYATGEALPLPVAQEFQDRFGFTVYDSYGCGEVRAWALLLNHRDAWRRGSLGLPTPGTTCRVIRDDGTECQDNEIGELYVHHSNLAMGYHADPDLSAERFVNGWYRTGDYVSRDHQGYLFYAGRREQLMITKNGFFSCIDIENRINQIPGVTDCVVITDEQASLHAFVQIHDDTAWQSIQHSEVGDDIAWYKVCEIPFTGTNKKIRSLSTLKQVSMA